MGRSMSQATYEKLRQLEAEGRRCQHGGCTSRATQALDMKVTDHDADGSLRHPSQAAKPPSEMLFCGRHARLTRGMFDRLGKPAEDGSVLVETDFANGGSQQQRLFGVRWLQRSS